ncbi:hypothetical protein OC834_000020 [Tilletia horrida]|nr:hypothetical protein OC834_000020 [Tilletia horrida]
MSKEDPKTRRSISCARITLALADLSPQPQRLATSTLRDTAEPNFRLPPRKVRLQPLPSTGSSAGINGTAPPPPASSFPNTPIAPPPGGAVMRSALSPLHPQSPLYPDGLVSPLWVRKHRDVIPSIFVLFQVLPQPTDNPAATGAPENNMSPAGSADTSEVDAALIRYISNLRSLLTSRSIKLTVVLLTSRASLSHPTLEPRLSHLRRASGLDSKGSLFVLTPVSEADLHEFIGSLQGALAEASTDYYREQGRRVRRKRGKYPPPPNAYGSPIDTPAGTPPPVAPLTKEGWSLRSAYKLGTFAELSGDLSLSLEHYVNAYDVLSSTAHPHNGGLLGDTRVLPPRTKRWAEAKALADSLVVRIARGWLLLGLEAHTFTVPVPPGEGSADAPPTPEKTRQVQVHLPSREAWERALGVFRAHLKRFEELSNGWGMGESTGEWWSWVGKQYRLFADLVDSIVRSYRNAPVMLSMILPEHCPPLPSNLLHPGALASYSAALNAATSGGGGGGSGIRPGHDRSASLASRSSTLPPPSSSSGMDIGGGVAQLQYNHLQQQYPHPSPNTSAGPLSLATSLALTLTGPAPLAPSPLASKSGVAPAAGVLPHPGQWYLLAALCAEERWRRWRIRLERERAAAAREGREGRELGQEDDPSTAVERKADHGALVIEALSRAYECLKRPAGSTTPTNTTMPNRSRTASYIAARMAHAYALSNQPGLALSFAQRILVPFRGSVHVNPAGSRPAPGRSEGVLLDLLLVGAIAAGQLEEEEALKEGKEGGSEVQNCSAGAQTGDGAAGGETSVLAEGKAVDGSGSAGAAAAAAQYRATRLRFLWEALCILASDSALSSRSAFLRASVQQEFAWLLYDASPVLSDQKAGAAEPVVLEGGVGAHGALFRADAVFWEENVEVGQEVRLQVRLHALLDAGVEAETETLPRAWRFGRLEVDVGHGAESRRTFVVEHAEAAEKGEGVVELAETTEGEAKVVRADLRLRVGGGHGQQGVGGLVLEGTVRAALAGSLQVLQVRLYNTDSATPCVIQLVPFKPDLHYAGLPARQAFWYLPAPHNRFLRLNHRLALSECIVKARTYAVRVSSSGEVKTPAQVVYLDEKFEVEVEVVNEEPDEELECSLEVACSLAEIAAEDGQEHQTDIISYQDQSSPTHLQGISLGRIAAGTSVKKTITFQANALVGPRQLYVSVRVRPPNPDADPDESSASKAGSDWGLADEKRHEAHLEVINPFEAKFALAWSQETPNASSAALRGDFVSAEDEVFVHPDGTPNGVLARLSAELGFVGAQTIDVESATLVLGHGEGGTLSTVRLYGDDGVFGEDDGTLSRRQHADRLAKDWSEDLRGEWAEGDRLVAHARIEVAREGGLDADLEQGAGVVELRWRRKGTDVELTRSVIPLPPIVAPPTPAVTITLLPPSVVRLGQPFLVRALVKNEQPFRTADVRLEVESSDNFVFAGARRMTIPALLPRSERQVVWRLMARHAGLAALPRVRAEDWRAKTSDGPGPGSTAVGDESALSTVSEAMPERAGGAIPVYDGRRLGSSAAILVGGAGATVVDVMQDELRQAMMSPPPTVPLSPAVSTAVAGTGTHARASVSLSRGVGGTAAPLPPSVAQQQRELHQLQQHGTGTGTGVGAPPSSYSTSSSSSSSSKAGHRALGPVRAPAQCLLLVLPP